YMLLEMMGENSNIKQIQNIDNLLTLIKTEDLKKYKSITEMITALTNSEYIGDFGSGLYIYKFKHNKDVSFNISLDNIDTYKPLGITYYLNDVEYAYRQFSSYPHGIMILPHSTNKRIDKSKNTHIMTPQEATEIASKEIKKEKYSKYFYALHDDRISPSLAYRPIIVTKDYTFNYNDTADYCYFVGLTINKDDDPYNCCKIVVNAENGNIMAVDFFNTYDMV
ncbi:MAG: hypothetical protein K2F65_05545, partial [Eubacterium sp.]|nr:hypothetical protein [Eubacterium sp.]